MKVLFVCTGNICRSPMGELLFPLFFHDETIVTDSAGTQGLIDSPIDPSSARLLEADGVDASAFRSKRLTPQLLDSSDLVLCFTARQKKQIAALSPRAAKRTFTVTDFANLCEVCQEQGMVLGDTVEARTASVMFNASMVRPLLRDGDDIADPYRKEFAAFQLAHDQLGEAIARMAHVLEPARGVHARVDISD